MDAVTEFAKLFRERDNPSVQGIGIGVAIKVDGEIKVRFNGFLLDGSLYVTARHVTMEEGDTVIVIPSADNQTYYIVGKVG